MNCFAVCSGSKDIFLKAGVAGVVGVADVVNVKGFNVEGGEVVVDKPNPEELARVVRLVLLLTDLLFLLDSFLLVLPLLPAACPNSDPATLNAKSIAGMMSKRI